MLKVLGLGGWLALPANPAGAQVIDILHSFGGGPNDGSLPGGSLIQINSNLYGLTQTGGQFGEGAIFAMGADGTGFNLLYSFGGSVGDGKIPSGSLVQLGSSIYGMTYFGGTRGNGTVFGIGIDGTNYTQIHLFAGGPGDGASPFGSLAQSGATLYGLTSEGGSVFNTTSGHYSNGAAFRINTDGTGLSLLHSFGAASDGQYPHYGAPVISGTTIYGMTSAGGSIDVGTVFKMNTDGTGYATLHNFAAAVGGDGAGPFGQLVLAGSTLYGMTAAGGDANDGTIFKINTDGTGYTILHSFMGGPADGTDPQGELILVGSSLYGMTGHGGADALGTIFGINTDGSDFEVLHSFTGGPNDGAGPSGDLLLVGSNFYGMTSAGGSSNDGVIFSYPVPEPSSFSLLAGAAAATFLARRRLARNRNHQ